MYSQFYGFSEKPFDITPDPRFLYMSRSHREVLASLIYGIRERRGFIAVLGEAGTGKTTLLRSALDRLKDCAKVAYIFNTDVTFLEMLQMILEEIGLLSRNEQVSKVEAYRRLNDLAIQQLSSGGNVVIMVDEAQNLDRSCLENLRLLSNLDTRRHKLIQIVLSGQPELEEKLRGNDLRQLSQRINLRRHILPLNEKETTEYIQQRLKVVRYAGAPLFTKKAEKLLWQTSGGIPRIINTLCDNALLIAFATKEQRVHEKTLREAIDDLHLGRFQKTSTQTTLPSPATISKSESPALRIGLFQVFLLVVCVSLLAGAGFLIFGHRGTKESLSLKSTIRSVITDVDVRESPSGGSAFSAQEIPSGAALLEAEITPPSPAHPASHFLNEQAGASEVKGEDAWKADERAVSEDLSEEVFVNARKGDTLYHIIFRHYGLYSKDIEKKVLNANPSIQNPNRIYISQSILMPRLAKQEKS